MPIFLDHTIVPAHDKEASARFFARIFGLEYKGPWGHFAPVKVNETLSLDFDNREVVEHHHYAFITSDDEFDVIFKRVQDEGLAYGSGPQQDDMQINHLHGGRGFTSTTPTATGWRSSLTRTCKHRAAALCPVLSWRNASKYVFQSQPRHGQWIAFTVEILAERIPKYLTVAGAQSK